MLFIGYRETIDLFDFVLTGMITKDANLTHQKKISLIQKKFLPFYANVLAGAP
jgi:hypothetical protein